MSMICREQKKEPKGTGDCGNLKTSLKSELLGGYDRDSK